MGKMVVAESAVWTKENDPSCKDKRYVPVPRSPSTTESTHAGFFISKKIENAFIFLIAYFCKIDEHPYKRMLVITSISCIHSIEYVALNRQSYSISPWLSIQVAKKQSFLVLEMVARAVIADVEEIAPVASVEFDSVVSGDSSAREVGVEGFMKP